MPEGCACKASGILLLHSPMCSSKGLWASEPCLAMFLLPKGHATAYSLNTPKQPFFSPLLLWSQCDERPDCQIAAAGTC